MSLPDRLDGLGPTNPGERPTYDLLTGRVNLLDMDSLTEATIELAHSGERHFVANHNMHSISLLQHDIKLRAAYERADLTFIDGMPLVGIGRLLGIPAERSHRTTYVDWVMPLLARCARDGINVAHIGSTNDVNEVAALEIERVIPSLRLAYHDGYFDVRSNQNLAVLAWLEDLRPQLLMVGMGMPRQEHWLADNWDRLPPCVVLNVGACFEYIAGAQRTPPRWMGRLGVEWLARLMSDPRRLWRRYLLEPVGLVLPIIRARVALQHGARARLRSPETAQG